MTHTFSLGGGVAITLTRLALGCPVSTAKQERHGTGLLVHLLRHTDETASDA